MRVWFKQGVLGELAPIAQKGFGKVVRLYEREGLENFYVTSIREGNHSAGSLHYIGRAFDFHHQDVEASKVKAVLGNDWDVVVYDTFYHAEYDPK